MIYDYMNSFCRTLFCSCMIFPILLCFRSWRHFVEKRKERFSACHHKNSNIIHEIFKKKLPRRQEEWEKKTQKESISFKFMRFIQEKEQKKISLPVISFLMNRVVAKKKCKKGKRNSGSVSGFFFPKTNERKDVISNNLRHMPWPQPILFCILHFLFFFVFGYHLKFKDPTPTCYPLFICENQFYFAIFFRYFFSFIYLFISFYYFISFFCLFSFSQITHTFDFHEAHF